MTEFNPPKFRCLTCKDVISSKYPGDLASCYCFKQSQRKMNELLDSMEFKDDGERHKTACEWNNKYSTGVYIDSTEHCTRFGGDVDNAEWIDDDS